MDVYSPPRRARAHGAAPDGTKQFAVSNLPGGGGGGLGRGGGSGGGPGGFGMLAIDMSIRGKRPARSLMGSLEPQLIAHGGTIPPLSDPWVAVPNVRSLGNTRSPSLPSRYPSGNLAATYGK
jgi:hypothetical protein